MIITIIQSQCMRIILPIFLFVGFFFFSCTTEPTEDQPGEETVVVEQVTPPSEEMENEQESSEESKAPEAAAVDNYEVSQELYEQTFEEIEAFISELNQVISRKQFDRWLRYLSKEYIRKYNSTEILNETNEYPQLKDNGIVLLDLRDYFDWVVVPSRSRAVLGEIVFVGETQVIAYSSYEGKRAKLYELEKIDDKWEITVWE